MRTGEQANAARGPDPISGFLDDHASELLERLSTWVRIPSVAADTARRVDVTRSAHWLAGEMRDAGLSAEVHETGEAAAVYAELLADPAARTVLVYSHHDVRHAKAEQWQQTDPFTPAVRDGRLYGRGASDAKGQVLAHVWAVRALLAAAGPGSPRINLKFLIEGEEETGSPHLESLIERHREKLACDLVVFSDTVQWKEDAPAPVTSMRGIVTATLTVTGAAQDVHSGVASGVTVNPALVLATVLSRIRDETGRITIPGFYDDIVPISDRRRSELAAVPYDDEDWTSRTDTRVVVGEPGYTPLERLWARPSLEVLGLLSGDPAGIERSVIPSEARASIGIRTVPGQSIPAVAAQLREFVAAQIPAEAEYALTVDEPRGQEPYTSPDGPVIDALERALARGYGRPVRGRVGNAGGGPADLLSQRLGAPVYFIGTGLPEDNWHANDESVSIRMLLQGAAAIAHLWRELAIDPGEG